MIRVQEQRKGHHEVLCTAGSYVLKSHHRSMLGFLEFFFSRGLNRCPKPARFHEEEDGELQHRANRFVPSRRSFLVALSPDRQKRRPSGGRRLGRGKIVGKDGKPGSASRLRMVDRTRRNGEKEKRRIPQSFSRWQPMGLGTCRSISMLTAVESRPDILPHRPVSELGNRRGTQRAKPGPNFGVTSARKYLGDRISQNGKRSVWKIQLSLLWNLTISLFLTRENGGRPQHARCSARSIYANRKCGH